MGAGSRVSVTPVTGRRPGEPLAAARPQLRQTRESRRLHILVETIDPYGPFGAKEVGEGPIVVTVGAIAAAVGDAIGEYVREMPMSPWRVLSAIRRKQTKATHSVAEQRARAN